MWVEVSTATASGRALIDWPDQVGKQLRPSPTASCLVSQSIVSNDGVTSHLAIGLSLFLPSVAIAIAEETKTAKLAAT